MVLLLLLVIFILHILLKAIVKALKIHVDYHFVISFSTPYEGLTIVILGEAVEFYWACF